MSKIIFVIGIDWGGKSFFIERYFDCRSPVIFACKTENYPIARNLSESAFEMTYLAPDYIGNH